MLEEIVCLLYFVLVLCLALSSGGCEGVSEGVCEGVRGASSRRRSGEGSLRGGAPGARDDGAPGAGGQRRSEATTHRSSRNKALQGLNRRQRRSLENQTEDL